MVWHACIHLILYTVWDYLQFIYRNPLKRFCRWRHYVGSQRQSTAIPDRSSGISTPVYCNPNGTLEMSTTIAKFPEDCRTPAEVFTFRLTALTITHLYVQRNVYCQYHCIKVTCLFRCNGSLQLHFFPTLWPAAWFTVSGHYVQLQPTKGSE